MVLTSSTVDSGLMAQLDRAKQEFNQVLKESENNFRNYSKVVGDIAKSPLNEWKDALFTTFIEPWIAAAAPLIESALPIYQDYARIMGMYYGVIIRIALVVLQVSGPIIRAAARLLNYLYSVQGGGIDWGALFGAYGGQGDYAAAIAWAMAPNESLQAWIAAHPDQWQQALNLDELQELRDQYSTVSIYGTFDWSAIANNYYSALANYYNVTIEYIQTLPIAEQQAMYNRMLEESQQ